MMKRIGLLLLLALDPLTAQDKGWTSLFNGEDFTGWKISENPGSFSIKDGPIMTHGPRAMCFYVGDFQNHTFKNFELMVDVMTMPSSNGGIFILTEFQDPGWPAKGFEVQVNNTYLKDLRKPASLYEVKDNGNEVAKDNEWTQPADWGGTKDFPGRRIAPGTIGLQAHDPEALCTTRTSGSSR